jgi:hypothetical protein
VSRNQDISEMQKLNGETVYAEFLWMGWMGWMGEKAGERVRERGERELFIAMAIAKHEAVANRRCRLRYLTFNNI